MKAAVGIAVVLALVAIVLSFVAISSEGESFERMTLSLTEEQEKEASLDVGREPALVFGSPVSGDATGEIAGFCLPAGEDGIGCIATYTLEDGTITTQNIRANDNDSITSPVIGGTGAYEGATGTRTIPDPESGEHTLELMVPDG